MVVNSPKRINHTTNIKLEPYSVVTDTSNIATDYTSIASNESFYDTPYTLDGRPVFGPWPKPILPMKSHSEANNTQKLTTNYIEYDVKKSSSDATMDVSIHYEKPSELSTTTINLVTAKCDSANQKDETESEHSIEVAASRLSPKEQNKLRFEHLQQRLSSLTAPLVSVLGTKIETSGESSTDQDLEINEIDNIKAPVVTLRSTSKSANINNDEISVGSACNTSSNYQRKRVLELLPNSSVASVATKTQKFMDATYYTNVNQEDIHLKSNEAKQKTSNPRNNNIAKEENINKLIAGVGKILRKDGGGIAALYKNALEEPDSRLSKILYSMLA
uniref:Uncharacterized protein n=1 Tax=Setaria digitata TaxID=48799 RepID=A0A915PG67_9BILA